MLEHPEYNEINDFVYGNSKNSKYLTLPTGQTRATLKLLGAVGDNVMSADNQQERLKSWIAGFVDGEGCFHVAINAQPRMTLGSQVLPEFRVVQHERDAETLSRIKETLGCGRVVRNRNNSGNCLELRVRGTQDLNKVVQFFRQYPLQTTKRHNFEKFAQVIELMNRCKHLTPEGIRVIAHIASQMNRRQDRRILRDYTLDTRNGEDIVRPA